MILLSSFFAIALPVVFSAVISPPINPHVGQVINVKWTNSPNDPPSWNLFLMNISTSFDLKANFGVINAKPQNINVTLPSFLRPSDDYVLYATNVSNWDWVFGSSGRFTILP